MMYCLFLILAIFHGATGRTTYIEPAARNLVSSHRHGHQQRRQLSWWGSLSQALHPPKKHKGSSTSSSTSNSGSTSTSGSSSTSTSSGSKTNQKVDCTSSSLDEMDESCGDRYWNYVNGERSYYDEDSEGSASYSFQDDSLSDDEDSEGSASYESASYASYESNNLSANGDQDGTLVNASSSATAVPLVLIVLAVAVAGAALVAARSRQQGAGMIRERTKNMGFIEVSRVRRAKEANDKGSPFLSEEEQSAAEVDPVEVESATDVGYGAARGGAATEVGSNAADVV